MSKQNIETALEEVKLARQALFVYIDDEETDCSDRRLERKLRRIIDMLEAMS